MDIKELGRFLSNPKDIEIAARVGDAWPFLRAQFLADNLERLTQEVIRKDPHAVLALLGSAVGRRDDLATLKAWPSISLGASKDTAGVLLFHYGFRRVNWPKGWTVGFEDKGGSQWRVVWCGLRAPDEANAKKFAKVFEMGLPRAAAVIIRDAITEVIQAFPALWRRSRVKDHVWWPAYVDVTSNDDLFCRPLAKEAIDELAEWFVRLIEAVDRTQRNCVDVVDIKSSDRWSDEMREATKAALEDWADLPPVENLGFKHIASGYGIIALSDLIAGKLRMTDRKTGQETIFANADALIRAGWVLD